MAAQLSRVQALVLIGLIWAGIYLPALGTLEIKGEEGRRILPGVTMLATGNWIVPSVGGMPYFSKPPLINWAIATAIGVSGKQNEWAARAPSSLSVLALGLGTVWLLADWLGGGGALLAAIFMLTGIGMMEKGRLAEIEAMYVSLFGLAVVVWVSFWRSSGTSVGRGAVWIGWTVPWIFLGLGLLTKGPLSLLFFYAIVAGILLAAGRVRELWSWPHLAGIAIMLGMFAAWALPYLHMTALERAGDVWSKQLANRLEIDETFRAGMWALNIPRGLVNFVPWMVLLPLLWRGQAHDPADAAILRGGRWAVAACFLGVSLAPGGVPRYTLPLIVPASVLLALAFAREALSGESPQWVVLVWGRTLKALLAVAAAGAGIAAWAGGGGWRWAAGIGLLAACVWLIRRSGRMPETGMGGIVACGIFSAGLMAILTMEYAIGAVPRLLSEERLRPAAIRMNAFVGNEAPIYVYQPGFLPLCFYLHPLSAIFAGNRQIARRRALPPGGCARLFARRQSVGGAGISGAASVYDRSSEPGDVVPAAPFRRAAVIWPPIFPSLLRGPRNPPYGGGRL